MLIVLLRLRYVYIIEHVHMWQIMCVFVCVCPAAMSGEH